MNNAMVSIIIPTYNGAGKLPNILNALELQSFKDFEVIIVIDGSTDNTMQMLQESKFNLTLKVFVQDNQGRAAVRNRGVSEALGDLLIFFDDDMRPSQDCVKQHVKHHQCELNTILIGNAEEDEKLLNNDIQRYRLSLSQKWYHSTKKYKVMYPFIMAANFSINKSLFLCLGMFDSRLNDAEDYDLAVRAFKNNVSIYIDPSIQAYHDDYISCRSYIIRQRQYQQAYEYLLKLKPDLHLSYHRKSLNASKGWKKYVLMFFASSIWVSAIDQEKFWLKMLPRGLRYKIYDLVITALGKVYVNKPV